MKHKNLQLTSLKKKIEITKPASKLKHLLISVGQKNAFLVFISLLIVIFTMRYSIRFISSRLEVENSQYTKQLTLENDRLEKTVLKIPDELEVIDQLVERNDVEQIIEMSEHSTLECNQKIMGEEAGLGIDECQNDKKKSFEAYSFGRFEATPAILSKEQYKRSLDNIFEDQVFSYVGFFISGRYTWAVYEDEDSKFRLFVGSRDKEVIDLAYQDNPELFFDPETY